MSSRRLRITHIIRAKPAGELGGADLHVADLAAEQLAAGHDVVVICLGRAEVTGLLRRRAIPHIEVASNSMRRWLRAVRLDVRRRRPDVLHSHGYRADLLSILVAPLLRRSSVGIAAMTVHGFIRTPVSLRLMSWLNERVLRRADLVIAVSAPERDRLAWLLDRPVVLIPNGVRAVPPLPRSTAAARLGVAADAAVVAFIGRLSPEKRPELFLQQAELVANNHPGAVFVLIGSGPLLPGLLRRSTRQARVRFTGLLADAAALLPAVDVLVCPSDSEGTPRVVVEAMLAGVPVVATRVGGLPSLIDHHRTGILVAPGSATELAGAVGELLSDRATAAVIAARASRQATARFTASTMAQATTGAYLSALRRPAAAGQPAPPGGAHRAEHRFGALANGSQP